MTSERPAKEVMPRLLRLGIARNRQHDHEPRTVTITDDEALDLYNYIRELEDN